MKQVNIIILDFGSQFTQLIARRIREIGVYCEVWPHDTALKCILDVKPCGIILSGSPNSVNDINKQLHIDEQIFNLNIPILGICYGMQIMAQKLGGIVEPSNVREFGHAQITRNYFKPSIIDALFNNNDDDVFCNVWMSHGDKVIEAPKNFQILCSTENCKIAVMGDIEKNLYGVQFHPEVTHTYNGFEFLKYFAIDICKTPLNWKIENIIPQYIQQIKETVGNKKVILGLSGGVDSSVAAVLIHKSIGSQLTCVFIDNGLLRLNEAEQVQSLFHENIGLKLITVDAKEYFMKSLAEVSDPEQKRKIIGKCFIDIFEQQSKLINDAEFLAQGTIYPDIIESAGNHNKTSHVIKSHHNVGGLPEHMKLNLLEPLKYLFKDEVRKLGVSLGLPHDILYRHPFPGPGLGVRIIGNIKEHYVALLQQADAIFIQELQSNYATDRDYNYGLCKEQDIGKSWYKLSSQAFVVFLPVKSVGVMGDGRTYDYVVALRAVQTNDFMTANWAHLPYELISKVSNRIINEINGINRVTYDISSKPPATIEWE